jgi:tetratricopeptide (TPR) repeat protein
MGREPTADELISGRLKRSPSYASELGDKTLTELDAIVNQRHQASEYGAQDDKVDQAGRTFTSQAARTARMSKLQDKFKRARELASHGQHEQAMRLVEELCEQADAWPELLVLKGDLIQLTDDDRYNLSDAEVAYSQAIDMDPYHVEAYAELAEFYASAMNNEDKASQMRKQGMKALMDRWKKLNAAAGEDQIDQPKDVMECMYFLVLRLLKDHGDVSASALSQKLVDLMDVHVDSGQVSWPKLHETFSMDELEKAV